MNSRPETCEEIITLCLSVPLEQKLSKRVFLFHNLMCDTVEMLRVLDFHWLANPLNDYCLSLFYFMQQLWGSKKFGFLCTPQIPVLWLVENRTTKPSLPCIVAEKEIIRYTFILSFPDITLKLLIAMFYNPYFKNTPSKANIQAWPLILLITAVKDLSRNI